MYSTNREVRSCSLRVSSCCCADEGRAGGRGGGGGGAGGAGGGGDHRPQPKATAVVDDAGANNSADDLFASMGMGMTMSNYKAATRVPQRSSAAVGSTLSGAGLSSRLRYQDDDDDDDDEGGGWD